MVSTTDISHVRSRSFVAFFLGYLRSRCESQNPFFYCELRTSIEVQYSMYLPDIRLRLNGTYWSVNAQSQENSVEHFNAAIMVADPIVHAEYETPVSKI